MKRSNRYLHCVGCFAVLLATAGACLVIASGGHCAATDDQAKDLYLKRSDSVAAIGTSTERPAVEKASSIKLKGSVLKEYPCPSNVFDVETEAPDTSTRSRLDAIISKSHSSGAQFDRLMSKGNDALLQGYLKQAEKNYYQAVRELKKTNKKDLRLARARNALANVLLRRGQAIDARDTFELARKTAMQNQGGQVEESKAIAGIATVARNSGDYKKAERLYQEALSIRRRMTGDIDRGMAQILLDLGEVYSAQKLYAEAEPVYQLALETLNKCSGVPDLTKAYFLDKTGMFFHRQAKMPEASRCFAMSLDLKDRYTTLYSPVDGRKRGLVYYRCENGIPNAARVFNRANEIEYLKVKKAIAVSTLTAQIYAADWYLLKAEVTIQNLGNKSISACGESPTLTVERPKRKVMTPLDSYAIARELGLRGRLLYSRLLHSADHLYTLQSVSYTRPVAVGIGPFGARLFNTVGGWTAITPDWGARIAARNAAIRSLASVQSHGRSLLATKPSPLTIGPGESATFQIFYPYETFDNCTLRFMVGNAVMEFPFTSKSG